MVAGFQRWISLLRSVVRLRWRCTDVIPRHIAAISCRRRRHPVTASHFCRFLHSIRRFIQRPWRIPSRSRGVPDIERMSGCRRVCWVETNHGRASPACTHCQNLSSVDNTPTGHPAELRTLTEQYQILPSEFQTWMVGRRVTGVVEQCHI